LFFFLFWRISLRCESDTHAYTFLSLLSCWCLVVNQREGCHGRVLSFIKEKKKQANKLMRRWENKNKAKRVLVKWTGAVQEAKIQLRAWPESS
jgi:hypothetical protein